MANSEWERLRKGEDDFAIDSFHHIVRQSLVRHKLITPHTIITFNYIIKLKMEFVNAMTIATENYTL